MSDTKTDLIRFRTLLESIDVDESHSGPNMSYCAFENTSRAIDQLAEMMGDAIESGEPLSFTSHEEQHYFDNMPDKIQFFTEILDQYNEQFETDTSRSLVNYGHDAADDPEPEF